MIDILYVSPGPDGMDFGYTWDERSWAAWERWQECKNHLERLYRYIIFVTLTRGTKGRSNGKNKTSTR